MSERIPVGSKYILFWLTMTGGYAGGTVGDALAGDALTSALVDLYPKDVGYDFADAPTVQQTGGGVQIMNIIIGDRHANPFNISSAVLNNTLAALMTGSALDTTNSEFTYFTFNPMNIVLPAMGMAVLQQYYSPSRLQNQKYWLTAVFPNITAEPKFGNVAENAAAVMNYRITPNMSDVDHRGYQFDAAARMLPTDNMTDHYFIETAYPIHIATTKAASTAAINATLPYLPVSSVVTVNASSNDAYQNGTAAALTSTSTSTGATVFPAGAANDIWVDTYQTNYVES